MKKSVALFCFLLGAGELFSQNETNEYWEWFSAWKIKLANELCYTLQYTEHYHDTLPETHTTALVWVDNAHFYLNELDSTLLHVTDDSIWLFENKYANISYGPKEYETAGINRYYYIRDRFSWNLFRYVPIYSRPGRTTLSGSIDSVIDTSIDGTAYHIVRTSLQESFLFNEETQEFDIPLTDYIWYYCNDEIKWVDKVIVAQTADCSGRYVVYEFKDIENSVRDLDLSLFSMDNSFYKNYFVYDFTKEASPSVIGKGTDNTLMTDEILDFPMVNALGDSVRLRDMDGWILLDFWTYGCRPCAEFWRSMQKEKDSLGYRRLEHAGIRMFCINSKGGLTEKFLNHAQYFQAVDIMYASRGMHLLRVDTYPTYYLFSPNRELVFCGSAMDVTDTLLKAKHEYEHSHKSQTRRMTVPRGPVIELDKEEYDYGTMLEGDDGRCIFMIKNSGDQPLVIDHVSSSCGCTTAEYPQKPIEPGKSGRIVVKYGTSNIGSFRKTLVVVSNAMNHPKKVLKIKGRVLKRD